MPVPKRRRPFTAQAAVFVLVILAGAVLLIAWIVTVIAGIVTLIRH